MDSIKIWVWIESLIKKISEKSDLSRIDIIKKIDEVDFFPEEKKDFLNIYSFLILQSLKEILNNKICPNNFFIIWWGWNVNIIRNHFEKINLNEYQIKQAWKINFIIPDVTKIWLIENVEEIISKSNLNIISMIIVYSKILENKNDVIEKSLEKAVKSIMEN